jgi:hypothetical protein
MLSGSGLSMYSTCSGIVIDCRGLHAKAKGAIRFSRELLSKKANIGTLSQ